MQIAQQAALARAAKSLNESLDLNRVLVRICHEAASILDGDNAVVYRGDGPRRRGVEATYGMPPEAIGYRMAPGTGLAGKVAELGPPAPDQRLPGPAAARPTPRCSARSAAALAVPMHWDGELRGVLAVGYTRAHHVTTRAPEPARGLRRAGRRGVPQRQRPRRPGPGGAHRRPHRLPQPRGDARRAAARDRALRAHRPPAVAGAGRHGRLQAGQRGARPPGGRRGAAPRRRTRCARPCAPTTWWPATAATSSRSWPIEADERGGLRGGGPRARAACAARSTTCRRRRGGGRGQRRRGRVEPGRDAHRR